MKKDCRQTKLKYIVKIRVLLEVRAERIITFLRVSPSGKIGLRESIVKIFAIMGKLL